MACSVYGAQYLLEGLYKYNEAQYASDLITDTSGDRNWWNMIQLGSTMALEAWDVKYKPNLDWNHAWGTAPLNVITRYMWGIKPKTPGFKIAEIKPQLADLTFSNITVPTKNGVIEADFKKESDKKDIYSIDIPENLTAVFIVPNNANKVYLNKKKVKHSKNLKLSNGLSKIEIKY